MCFPHKPSGMENNTRKYNMTSVEEDITELAKSYTMYEIGKLEKVNYVSLKEDSDFYVIWKWTVLTKKSTLQILVVDKLCLNR